MLRSLLRTGALASCLLGTLAHAQSTVNLIEAGAAPREAMRYRFDAGRTERAALDTSMRMTIAMAGQQLPMAALPPIHMIMQLRASEVATDGSARIDFELVTAEATAADPAATAEANQSLAGVTGMSGWYRLSTQGVTSGGALNVAGNAPAGADVLADFQQTIQQLGAPFPAEPVGTGARWQVRQQTDAGGLKVSQTAEFTLRSRQGRRVTLDLKIIEATVEAGGVLPAGAQLGAVNISGGGSIVVDLDRLVPTSTMDIDTSVAVSMAAQGQTQSMTLDLALTQKLAPAPAQ